MYVYICMCVFFIYLFIYLLHAPVLGVILHAPLLGVILHAYYTIYRFYKQYLYNVLFCNFIGFRQLAVSCYLRDTVV
jgi:hypothetical protein